MKISGHSELPKIIENPLTFNLFMSAYNLYKIDRT